MRSIQTSMAFPLSSVKPLDRLLSYRTYCLSETRKALQGSTYRRQRSPIGGAILEPVGEVEGLAYARCPETGSLFLAELPAESGRWATLLAQTCRYRHSPAAFHADLAQSRTDNVYAPKLEWIRDTLRLQGLERPRMLEVMTPPSDFTPLLKESGMFATVLAVDEQSLVATPRRPGQDSAEAAVLLESLDRVEDPAALLQAVAERLTDRGLVFVTALVASGFDVTVLGLRNLYLYPPDRTNCFTVQGLSQLLERSGFTLVEVSTPGVLDVAIVKAHLQQDPLLDLPAFERQLIAADQDTHEAFQAFLQQQGLSSFARMVARRSR